MPVTEKIYNDPEAGPVRLSKSSVSRRISIRVHPADGVKVIIPRSLSFDEGLRFFILKRDWVISVMARQRAKAEIAKREGKALPVLGDGVSVKTLMSEILFVRGASGADGSSARAMSVKVDTVCVEDVKLTGRTFLSLDMPLFRKTVTYSGRLQEGSVELDAVLRKVLVEMLRTEAKLILPQKVAFFAERFGFSFGNVTVKHNSSNWGSCSAKGNINLNLNLVRLPETLCDYVVLHELCHLRYRDHGAGFHSLLEKLCTDNVIRLAKSGAPEMGRIVSAVNGCRAGLPVSKTLEREMKGYRLV